MALTFNKIPNSNLAKARENESERPYFNPAFLGSFAGQVTGTLKAKIGEERTAIQVEKGVTIEIDIPGILTKGKAYIVSQVEKEKGDGTPYVLTTISLDIQGYKAVRDDLVARAIIATEKHLYSATHESAEQAVETNEA